jgi:O-antigen/teichoic acid export membrane protein
VLRPEDFGLMAMAMVVIGFSQAYSDMGISAAIVHKQDVTSEHLSSLYWLNIIAGLLIYLLVLIATPLS